MNIPIESISGADFSPFGEVIDFPEGFGEAFYVAASDGENPWRLALYRYDDAPMARMERHPESRESFEPHQGASLLLVATAEAPGAPRAFFLDRPVCLHKGIWHQVMALTPTACVKITENFEVRSEFFTLPHPLRAVLAQ